uniref:Dynein heavy chain AAA 5 extension domain-containing protein n=1 Tax=Timema monikensis TaxID=170555 RepID=A0A7R9HND0_9NEOP|nr:unnamed protein product [Timema monikensis]
MLLSQSLPGRSRLIALIEQDSRGTRWFHRSIVCMRTGRSLLNQHSSEMLMLMLMLQVTQMCFMLDAMIPVYEDSDNETILGDLLECIFIQALYFSLGASLLHDDRLEFDDFVKRQCSLLVMEDSSDNKCTFR